MDIPVPDGENMFDDDMTQCHFVTDRQTDVLREHSPRYAYASSGKKTRAHGDIITSTFNVFRHNIRKRFFKDNINDFQEQSSTIQYKIQQGITNKNETS